jgi:hypothetical protein
MCVQLTANNLREQQSAAVARDQLAAAQQRQMTDMMRRLQQEGGLNNIHAMQQMYQMQLQQQHQAAFAQAAGVIRPTPADTAGPATLR